MRFQAPRGTHDILPADVGKWLRLENIFRNVCHRYRFSEIRTPLFESTALFKRSSGESSDVVRKQMYTFVDAGDEEITLRPEGTAPVARAFIERSLQSKQPVWKLSYIIPVFRYERPQSGRYRQHHQVGVELFGSAAAQADAEVISLGLDFLHEVGITGEVLQLNSIGCTVCRPRYRELLREALAPVLKDLCEDCKERYKLNPLRILDCKNERCGELTRDAPRMLDHLCNDCRAHFDELQLLLASADIGFEINPRLVRGLDYYNRTVFEVIHGSLGSQNTMLAGGRYDGLIELLGGNSTPGVGFGCGIERVLMAAGESPTLACNECGPDVFVASIGNAARKVTFELVRELRTNHFSAEIDYLDRSLKAQMREANRQNASVAVIIGESELAKNEVMIRNLKTGQQCQCPISDVIETIRGILEGTKTS